MCATNNASAPHSQNASVRRSFCIADAMETIDMYGTDCVVVVDERNLLLRIVGTDVDRLSCARDGDVCIGEP